MYIRTACYEWHGMVLVALLLDSCFIFHEWHDIYITLANTWRVNDPVSRQRPTL